MHYYLKKVFFLWLLGCSMVMYGQDNAPIVHLTADVVMGTAPLTVNFSSVGTTDLEGEGISNYLWNLGDGTTTNTTVETTFSHTYLIPGIYTVTLLALEQSHPITNPIPLLGDAKITIRVRAPAGMYDLKFPPTEDASLVGGIIDNTYSLRTHTNQNGGAAYIKFDLSNISGCGAITDMDLTLISENISNQTGNVQVHLGSHSNWNESDFGMPLAPPVSTSLLKEINQTYPLGVATTWGSLGLSSASEFSLIVSTDTPGPDFSFGSSELFGDEPCLTVHLDNSGAGCAFSGVTVAPKIILGGPFSVNGIALMDDDLRQQNLIPMSDPYGLGVMREPYTSSDYGDKAIVDWVLVQLRDKIDPTIILAEEAALVRRDGQVVSPENNLSALVIEGVDADDYYVAIKHRNHLAMMTASPVTLNNTPATVDFTNPSTATYTIAGDPAQKMETVNGVDYMVMYAGNVIGDNWIRLSGPVFINDGEAFVNYLGNYSNVISSVYHEADVNTDGTARLSGPIFINDGAVIVNTLGSFNNVITEQLP